MQKTLLTALQGISEIIIQFNREHKQVKNKKSLCTRKEVCAVYTFVCTVCVAVEKHNQEYINLIISFLVLKQMNGWMFGQLSYLVPGICQLEVHFLVYM